VTTTSPDSGSTPGTTGTSEASTDGGAAPFDAPSADRGSSPASGDGGEGEGGSSVAAGDAGLCCIAAHGTLPFDAGWTATGDGGLCDHAGTLGLIEPCP
jgi:hypothetical protein